MSLHLAEEILEHYNGYKNEIVAEIAQYSYRKKRYGVDFTVALYLAQKPIDAAIIEESIRDTDKVIALEPNFYAVVFDFSDESGGLKAAENVFAKLEPALFGSDVFISVVNSSVTVDDDEQVRKALNILIDEINKHFEGVPLSTEEEDTL